ncbi:hypothetical protein DFJ74DRAFT_682127 [Hyaloraphidium curvatum]|nr:hypothetical protein DFJ74DRAFT_682127 [Hyaloraphidium curvatum]
MGYEQPGTFPAPERVRGRTIVDYLDGRREYMARHGAAGLWRVHDSLYDLTNFEHPGGQDWLEITKGTDVTELFESHHLDIERVRAILNKYRVRDADFPRESPLTFNPDGFYSVLRARALAKVKEVGPRPKLLSKLVADGTAGLYLFLILRAAYKRSVGLAVAAGAAAGALSTIAHNFGHQAENWRRYYMDLVGSPSRTWRIHHEISHHMYPNSSLDIEPVITAYTLGQSFDIDKPRSPNSKAWDMIRLFLVYGYFGAWMPFYLYPIHQKRKELLYYLVFAAMLLSRRANRALRPLLPWGLLETAGLWCLARGVHSAWIAATGLLVGHYSDDTWRQGEERPGMEEIRDFGLFQLETSGDRVELYAPTTDLMLPAVLSTFGDHTLHHLFPTVDHGYHRHLYPVLAQTCNEFGVRFEFRRWSEMLTGAVAQMRRTEKLESRRRVGWDGGFGKGWVDAEVAGFAVDAKK